MTNKKILMKFISAQQQKSQPIVSDQGFKNGAPPEGTNYRIPSDTLYNPTPFQIKAVSDNGIEKVLQPNDTSNVHFPGAQYVDEYQMKNGGLTKYLPKAEYGNMPTSDFEVIFDPSKSVIENVELNRRAQVMGWNSVAEYEKSGWSKKGYAKVPDVVRQQRIAKGVSADQIPEYEKIQEKKVSSKLQSIIDTQEARSANDKAKADKEKHDRDIKNFRPAPVNDPAGLPSVPIFETALMAPVALGSAGLAGLGEATYAAGAASPFLQATGAALGSSPAWTPGLSIGNSVNAAFAANGLKTLVNGEAIEPWKRAVRTGNVSDYLSAAGQNLMTGLEILPVAAPLVKGGLELARPAAEMFGDLSKSGKNYLFARQFSNQVSKTKLPNETPLQKLAKRIDPIERSSVGVQNDILEHYGKSVYDDAVNDLYQRYKHAYDAPLIEFKSSKPSSFMEGIGSEDDFGQGMLFKEKYCAPGSECARTSNAITSKVFSDITGLPFATNENAHNAWHLEDQITRHGGKNVTDAVLQDHNFKVGDRILMGNGVDQSTHVPGYTADSEVRHAGFFAGYMKNKDGNFVPLLMESGENNSMFLNPLNANFTGSNSLKQVIRPQQILDDTFSKGLVDKNIRYAYRDKPSVATYSSDNPAAQQILDQAQTYREQIKRTHDLTNDEFDELLNGLIGIGAQETKLNAQLPSPFLPKAKIKLQNTLVNAGLTAPIKTVINTGKRIGNFATSKSSFLPEYPGTSFIEMQAAKMAEAENIPFTDAVQTIKNQYQPKPTFTPSTIEPSKGMFRQKFQTEPARTAGIDQNITKDELANGLSQMAENYTKMKSMYPDASKRDLINLTTLSWNSPGKAQNKELVDFFLFGKNNPDPSRFKFDYLNKVNNHRENLINVHPQIGDAIHREIFRAGYPEIQYKTGGDVDKYQKAGTVKQSDAATPTFGGQQPQFLRQAGPTFENLRKFMGTDNIRMYDPHANPEPGNMSQDQQDNSPIGSLIELFDPTGIMSHDDANKAINDWKASGNSIPTMDQALSIFSAVPALGKYGKFSYLVGAGADGMKALYKSFPWQQALNIWEMQSESQGDKMPTKAYGGMTSTSNMKKYQVAGTVTPSLWSEAMEQLQYLQENPSTWKDDPDMQGPGGKLNLCLDCINVDWKNPEHIKDAYRLIEQGYSMGTHYNEEAFHQGLQTLGLQPPVYNSKPAGAAGTTMKALGGPISDFDVYNIPQFMMGGGQPCYECGGKYAAGGLTNCPEGMVPDANGNCVDDLATVPTPNSSLYPYYQQNLNKYGAAVAAKMLRSKRQCHPGDECWEETEQPTQPVQSFQDASENYTLQDSGNPGVAYLHYKKNNGDGTYTSKQLGSTLVSDWLNDEQQKQFYSTHGGSARVNYNPDIKMYTDVKDASTIVENFRKAEKEKQKQSLQQRASGGDIMPFEEFDNDPKIKKGKTLFGRPYQIVETEAGPTVNGRERPGETTRVKTVYYKNGNVAKQIIDNNEVGGNETTWHDKDGKVTAAENSMGYRTFSNGYFDYENNSDYEASKRRKDETEMFDYGNKLDAFIKRANLNLENMSKDGSQPGDSYNTIWSDWENSKSDYTRTKNPDVRKSTAKFAPGGLYNGENSNQYKEGDYQLDTTTSHTLNDLENNGWNRGLAKVNSMGNPNSMMWALPNRGFGSGLKAVAGLASGLSGAVLGYEKLFNNKETTNSTLYNDETNEYGKTQDVLKARYDKANPTQPAKQPQAPAPAAAPSMMPYGLSPELLQQIGNQTKSMPGASAKTPTLNADWAKGYGQEQLTKSMAESEAYDAEKKKAMDSNMNPYPPDYDPATGYFGISGDFSQRILYKDGKPEERFVEGEPTGVYKAAYRESPEDIAAFHKEGYYKKKNGDGSTRDWSDWDTDPKTGEYINLQDSPALAAELGYDVPGYNSATAPTTPAVDGMSHQDKMDQNWMDNGYIKDASGQWVEKDKPQQQVTTTTPTPTQPNIPTGSTPNQMVNRGQGTLKQDADGNYIYGSDATGWSKSMNRNVAESQWRNGSYNHTPAQAPVAPAGIPNGLQNFMNGVQMKKEGGLTKFWPGGPFDQEAFKNMINQQMGKTGTGVHTDIQEDGQQTGSYGAFNKSSSDPKVEMQKQWETKQYGDSAGFIAANNALNGMGMFNDVLEAKDYERQYSRHMRDMGNTDSMYNAENPVNPFGSYTPNVGPGSNYSLVTNGFAQDFGTKSVAAKYGGTKQYRQGGTYHVSQDELMYILANGGEIEYL